MTFQVYWNENAEAELADTWMRSSDKQQITESARRIDDLLRRRPLQIGESRDVSHRRVLFCPPLVVHYFVREPKATVVVTHVRVSKKFR